MPVIGALAFGVVTGWVTYRTLRRVKSEGLSDIATVVGIVGGAAITGLFPAGGEAFGAYGIGLAAGFFFYLIVSLFVAARSTNSVGLKAANEWLGEPPVPGGRLNPGASPNTTGQTGTRIAPPRPGQTGA